MMEDKFWTKTITPQKWLQKVKDDWPWRRQKANMEKEFAEDPVNARKHSTEFVQNALTNDDLIFYWNLCHEIEPVLCKLWDDIDLTSSKLERNVVGMLTEQWMNAYEGQKAVEKQSAVGSSFHSIIQNVDEEKLMAELHKRIMPGTKPAVIGATLAYCHFERHWFIKVPSREMFEEEFPNCGNWNSIKSYFAERNRDKAKNIIIEL